MNTMSNDELNDLRLAHTSKEIFEVTADAQLELDDEDEDGCSDEYPFGKSKDVLQADEQALKLHSECTKFGDKFRSLCREIDSYAPYIIALKRKFSVKKGYAGHKVSFPDKLRVERRILRKPPEALCRPSPMRGRLPCSQGLRHFIRLRRSVSYD